MGLSKNITLTIKDYEIKLDKQIKFYENDTINLCFSILEYGIEVKNGVSINKLMPIQALRSYMLIETPQGIDYAESTIIENNKIVFNLGSKYSRFVGIGHMQIVIKDSDGCRVTLPEFEFEIKKSINTDWDRESYLLTTEDDSIIIDEFGREIHMTKISDLPESENLSEESYAIIVDGEGNKRLKVRTIADAVEDSLDAKFNVHVDEINEDVERIEGEINEISESLEQSVKFKVVGEGIVVPPINGDSSYILPIATKTTLGGVKIGNNLSIDSNGVLSATTNGNSNITISNTLDNYEGNTLSDKMIAMFNDINTNHKNTPMIITLPDGIIEITSDLRAIGWTNKIFIGNAYLYYKNCNAIEFIQCMHCNFYIHASSSSNLDIANGNILGLINPSSVASLTKRGYKITDCSYNEFKFNNIIGFTNGIEIYSEYGAKGSFYNNIYFTGIWRCQRPIIFKTGKATDDTSAQSGWITEIYIHGGMFDCDDGILIGQEVENRPTNEPSDNYQGLKFYNIGVEHVRKQADGRGIYFLQGKNNAVINPRFEGSMGTGNSTSGAYILVEESGYACNNKIETSNYPINVDRVKLNYLAKQLVNPNYDNPAGSYVEGDLCDTTGYKCGYKAIATPGKMVYEAKNLSNYYLQNAKPNTFNYVYSDTEFAKIKCSDGTIKSIGYTS